MCSIMYRCLKLQLTSTNNCKNWVMSLAFLKVGKIITYNILSNLLEIGRPTYNTHLQVDIYIFKFRSSLLNLRVLNKNIDIGRLDPPREQRICHVYNMNIVLNLCPCYRNLRTKYLWEYCT